MFDFDVFVVKNYVIKNVKTNLWSDCGKGYRKKENTITSLITLGNIIYIVIEGRWYLRLLEEFCIYGTKIRGICCIHSIWSDSL